MKKIRFLFILAMIFTAFPAAAGAANIGDVIGQAVYSDIGTYINHYPISSYAIDGYTVVVAEDLANYGCDVVWNQNDRALYITRSSSKTAFSCGKVFKTSNPTGTKFADLLYTDIAVFVNGNRVPSYAINGYTMITIEDFGKYMNGFNWCQDIRAAKAWIDGFNCAEYKPLYQRTIHMYYSDEWDSYSHSGSFDFDSDGVEEAYSVKLTDEGCKMTVKIGNDTKIIQTDYGCLTDVFICNLNAGDNWTLAIATIETSGDPQFYMLTYENKVMKHEYFYEPEDYVANHKRYWDYLGYVDKVYFNVNDDNTFTLKKQTRSYGMWYVYKTYQLVNDSYREIVPQYYEILPDFMRSRTEYLKLSGKELEMWNKGFAKAYINYYNNGFKINKGEYFKLLYDDGKNNIYVVKENGTAGWINLSGDFEQRYKLNDYLLYLAG